MKLTLAQSALLVLAPLLSGCAPSSSVPSALTGPRAELAAFPGKNALSPERAPSGRSAPAPLPERSPSTVSAGALLPLPVPDYEPAVIVLPNETRAARPVLVVTHGAGGSPEEHCSFYRSFVRGRGFILCPRGEPTDRRLPPGESGFFYRDHRALEREVRAAFAALKEAFGDRVDARAPIYAGFSQGAIMGALFLPSRPVLFARGVFIEGGVGEYEEWTLATARAFAEGGGKRALLACGRPRCFAAAQRTVALLARGGIEARAADGTGAGHTYGGAVGDAVAAALPWLLEGDDRWATP